MDFADATLVRVAEREGLKTILTIEPTSRPIALDATPSSGYYRRADRTWQRTPET